MAQNDGIGDFIVNFEHISLLVLVFFIVNFEHVIASWVNRKKIIHVSNNLLKIISMQLQQIGYGKTLKRQKQPPEVFYKKSRS